VVAEIIRAYEPTPVREAATEPEEME